MSIMDLKERYDSFQKDAVKAIKKDFAKKLNGRYLLVIPTGGGKTYTAVKSICALFDDGTLDPKKHKIFWTAHREELMEQAIGTFEKHIKSTKDTSVILANNIVVDMLSKMESALNSDSDIKIVVIDEAHHSAAKSYQSVFGKKDIGVLGLTATPSRHDGKPLDFEKESYSIGFPDLVKKGIILKPIINKIEGDEYFISDIGNEEDLQQLDNAIRNKKILSALIDTHEEYSKVIVYVGTKKHAKNLYKLIVESSLMDHYESISYIIGGDNSRGQTRKDYIDQEKKYKRSILVNVQVLTEGYDDPTVNTVIMACPSKSKLYYMQAIGRAVRSDPGNELKKSYVVEVEDTLPNIRYRIDNRWLFSEISDALEPIVEDRDYSDEDSLNSVLSAIYEKENVPEKYRSFPRYDEDYRYSLLLFRVYKEKDNYVSVPILMDNDNRPRVSNLYNFISERMTGSGFRKKETHHNAVFNMAGNAGHAVVPEAIEKHIFHAMINAGAIVDEKEEDLEQWVVGGAPWVIYYALNHQESESSLTDEVLGFTEEMINKDIIRESILSNSYEKGNVLIRLPLPLRNYMGKFVTQHEYEVINDLIKRLNEIREDGELDHRDDLNRVMEKSSLPLEFREFDSLILITRDSIKYSMEKF